MVAEYRKGRDLFTRLGSVPAQEQGYKEIRAELVGHADYLSSEAVISRMSDNDNITAIHWALMINNSFYSLQHTPDAYEE